MINQALVLSGLLCLFCDNIYSQEKEKSSQYKSEPVWIQLMNDTSANYFETCKAFREYYEDRAMPKEPFEVEVSDSFEREIGLDDHDGGAKSEKEKEREGRKLNPNEISYAAEVRAFRGWFFETKPWVRDDGQIIGPVERQQIVDKQTQELKAIERANGKK